MGQGEARKAVPSAIGRYQILRELGRGAMGVVYEAHDPALSRNIALKVIQPLALGDVRMSETFEKRFQAEARIAAQLSHPGIVVVHDVGRDDESGTLFIALEHLEGRTLAEMTEDGRPIPWREAVRLTLGVARALDHAHAQGVIHRDMKPANVMVLASGETKIMDFGIASVEEARARLTAPGDFLGTPLYMAPEQALEGSADQRTDIFSLGAIAYTLLTGRPPFEGSNLLQLAARVVKDDPPPPSSLVPGIPAEVDRVVARAMAKAPEDRYPDARSMAAELQAILESRGRGAEGEVELVLAEEDPLAALVSGAAPARRSAAARPAGPSPATPSPAPATEPAGPMVGSRSAVSAALLLLALGLALVVAWWRERTTSIVPATNTATAPAAAPASPSAPSPRPVESPPASAEVGRLAVDFEHPLESGTLRIWVDDEPVLEEKLSGRVSKNALVFKLRKGTFNDVLEVSPGRHWVRVQVQWEDKEKTEQITGSFKPGVTRRLEVRVGRLRKNLSLEWK